MKNLSACSPKRHTLQSSGLAVNPDRTQTELKNGFDPLNAINAFIIKGLVHLYAAPKRSTA